MQVNSMAGKKPKPAAAREAEPTAAPPKYEATEGEKSALRDFFARRGKALHAPRLKVSKNGSNLVVGPDHPDETIGFMLLAQAFGSTDAAFVNGMIRQLVNAGTQGREPDDEGINFLLSVVKGVKPRDEIEAMLAVQMAAIHTATMTFARRLCFGVQFWV
ncbi:MAG: hypothetical protein WAU78_05645 [Roseiarcus sp.]